ncbi:LytR/AlgR family response regulator transcription factor [Halobacillus salinus]|uniref:LytR/AlgR family response regulator transcription factor n=1 Tax=Halobacillus salinus TaxID=192814 RepID=UPI0009A61724|nr:LytTR family DNA-binding domain-containing protein [Halobacillus salinus]
MIGATVVIAEDHNDAREILREFVNLHSDFTVVGEVESGSELLQAVNELEPDLLMVDINMPRMNGVDAVKECLEVYKDLSFIFVTAYDDYAVEAFNLQAVDYVVKPVHKKRVFSALEKAKLSIKQQRHRWNQKVEVKFGREIYFIDLDHILFVEKIARKLYIHTHHEVYETIDTLEHFEKQLNDDFYKSHRSCFVNVHHLTSIKISGKSYLGYFSGYDKPAPISKQRIEELKRKVKQSM